MLHVGDTDLTQSLHFIDDDTQLEEVKLIPTGVIEFTEDPHTLTLDQCSFLKVVTRTLWRPPFGATVSTWGDWACHNAWAWAWNERCGPGIPNTLQSIEELLTQGIPYSKCQQIPFCEQPSPDGFPFHSRNVISNKSVLRSLHQPCSWSLKSHWFHFTFLHNINNICQRETHGYSFI